MKTIGHYQFPETKEEALEWRRTVHLRSIATHVLAVATTRIEGSWAAYCDAVPGYDHYIECEAVLREGTKLMEDVARALFHEFDCLTYAT